jgi:hypothetical protein
MDSELSFVGIRSEEWLGLSGDNIDAILCQITQLQLALRREVNNGQSGILQKRRPEHYPLSRPIIRSILSRACQERRVLWKK